MMRGNKGGIRMYELKILITSMDGYALEYKQYMEKEIRELFPELIIEFEIIEIVQSLVMMCVKGVDLKLIAGIGHAIQSNFESKIIHCNFDAKLIYNFKKKIIEKS